MSQIYRHIIVSVFLMVVASCCYTQTTSQISGKWKSEDKRRNFQMEIYLAKDNYYYGRIINDTGGNSKNGTLVLKQLNYNEDEAEYNGIFEPPDAAISFRVKVSIENGNRLKLVVSKLLMSKTMYLTRIN
jgi:hypothetical protein